MVSQKWIIRIDEEYSQNLIQNFRWEYELKQFDFLKEVVPTFDIIGKK